MESHRADVIFAAVTVQTLTIGKELGRGKKYLEQRAGAYFVAGTCVSLDSVVYAFLRGESPEGIVESFPTKRIPPFTPAWMRGAG